MGRRATHRATLSGRAAATAVTLGVIGSVLMALSPASASAHSRAISAPASVSVKGQTITVLEDGGHDQYLQVFAKLPQFEKQYGVHVNLVREADYTTLVQKEIEAVRLGTSPYDVMTVPDTTTGSIASGLTPLAPFITQSGQTVAQFQAQYPQWVRTADTFNDQLLYYSFYAGAFAVLYRKSLFDNPANEAAFKQRFGYTLPNPPTTPSQLQDLALFFTKPGRYGIVFPAADDEGETLLRELMSREALTFTDAKGYAMWDSHYPRNRAAAQNAMTYIQDLIWKYHVAPRAVTGMETTGAGAYFAQCSAAMYFDLVYLTYSTALASQPKCGSIGSFPFPNFRPGGGSTVSYWMYGIPKTSAHKQAAWDYIRWISSPSNVELAAEGPNGTFVPTNKSIAAAVAQHGSIPTGVAAAVQQGLAYPITPENSAQIVVWTTLGEKLFGDSITPSQFIKQSAQAIDSAR